MLTNEGELQLLEGLSVQPEDEWLQLLYLTMCKKARCYDLLQCRTHMCSALEGLGWCLLGLGSSSFNGVFVLMWTVVDF